MVGEFSDDTIEPEQDSGWEENEPCINNSIVDHKIVELKGNFIPKGLVPLERMFSKDDTLIKPTLQTTEENVMEYNIGSEKQPQMIKLSKLLN